MPYTAITKPNTAQAAPKRGSNPDAKRMPEITKEATVTRLMKKIWKPRRDMVS